ncbi:MAG TPA: hypothetical protein VF423_10705 [Actinomycetes bacterium]
MSGDTTRTFGRRFFLVRAGRGVLGVAVVGLAACRTGGEGSGASGAGRSRSAPEPETASPPASTSPAEAAGLDWSRVDTGVGGSTDQIGAVPTM